MLHSQNPYKSLGPGDLGLLSVHSSKLKHRGDQAFVIAGPKLWNSLPVSIQTMSSLSIFKLKLKNHLFTVAF